MDDVLCSPSATLKTTRLYHRHPWYLQVNWTYHRVKYDHTILEKKKYDGEITSSKVIFKHIRENDKRTCPCPRPPQHIRSKNAGPLISSVNVNFLYIFIHAIGVHMVPQGGYQILDKFLLLVLLHIVLLGSAPEKRFSGSRFFYGPFIDHSFVVGTDFSWSRYLHDTLHRSRLVFVSTYFWTRSQ